MVARLAAAAFEFVVGDDWRTAAGVIGLLAATALLVAAGLPAWPLSVLAAIAVLLWSVRRASAEHCRVAEK
jgi:uncharacterized membrane protein YdjX (TVP38/TMEM64 family)